jgi:hypothetical protein
VIVLNRAFSSLGYFSVGLAEAEKNKNGASFLFFSASANPTEKYPNEGIEMEAFSRMPPMFILFVFVGIFDMFSMVGRRFSPQW